MLPLGIYILFLGYRNSSHLKVNDMQRRTHKTSALRDLKLYIDCSYNISSLYSFRNSPIIWIKVSGFSHQFFLVAQSQPRTPGETCWEDVPIRTSQSQEGLA